MVLHDGMYVCRLFVWQHWQCMLHCLQSHGSKYNSSQRLSLAVKCKGVRKFAQLKFQTGELGCGCDCFCGDAMRLCPYFGICESLLMAVCYNSTWILSQDVVHVAVFTAHGFFWSRFNLNRHILPHILMII